jgi:hypothetical protein
MGVKTMTIDKELDRHASAIRNHMRKLLEIHQQIVALGVKDPIGEMAREMMTPRETVEKIFDDARKINQ